nr:hypothetical protein [Tanacetum cinerariifolium]
MSSLFADTHNVVAILEKSDAAEGFEQIIDFLSGSYIHYALTAVIREILQVNDAEGMAFFSSQWKFLIHTILQSLSAKRTSWNEFSIAVASAVICLSKGVETPLFIGMIADRQPAEEELGAEQVQVDTAGAAAVVEDVVEDVAEDVAYVATPLPPPHGIPSPPQEPSSPPQQPYVKPPAPTQQLEIVNLKARVKKLEQTDKVKSSKLRRLRK